MRRYLLTFCCVFVLFAGWFCWAQKSDKPGREQLVLAAGFPIDDYTFSWTIARSGEARVDIDKGPRTIRVAIIKDSDVITVSPADAVMIGRALAWAPESAKRLAATQRAGEEEIKTGTYIITFRFSPEYGFSASVRNPQRFVLSSVRLDERAAAAFARPLQEAEVRVEWLKKRWPF